MAASILKSVFLTMMMLFLVLFVSTEAQTQQTCVSSLIPCADYLNGTVPPSQTCCKNIKDAVQTQLPCLCSLYQNPALLASFKVNISQALNLTRNCGVNANLTTCATGTATSPTSSPPPVPGSDGFRMTWTGFSSVILLAAYILFY